MRQIIFRGKWTNNGEWVEGYITLRPRAIQFGEHYSPWYIDRPPNDPDDSGGFYNVYPETVGQFTGLTDNNGKRIFEGDVLERTNYKGKKERWAVAFKYGAFGVFLDNEYGGYFEAFTDYDGTPPTDYEVIGNIHDNPELIEREGAK